MFNPFYLLPGSPRQQLGVLVLVVAIPLAAWRATAYVQSRSPYLNVMLGSTRVEGVAESGFHFQEYTDGEPFRWTNGYAKLVVPISTKRPPQQLWLSIEVFRPKIAPIRFQLLVDDEILFDGQAPPGRWERSFDLGAHRFSKQVLIELRSEAFVPKGVMDGGKNFDTRMLGVQVKGIMLQRDDSKMKNGRTSLAE
jgi:hypothetical protein